jgi:membrane associated rhomboid family serine protease
MAQPPKEALAALGIVVPARGSATRWVLIFLVGFGLLQAALRSLFHLGPLITVLMASPAHKLELWRVLTAGTVMPEGFLNALFSLLIIWFFGPEVERRLGKWSFVGFLLLASTMGYSLALCLDWLPIPLAQLHQSAMFGPSVATTALLVAWSSANRDQMINLFFKVPIRGGALRWVSLAMIVGQALVLEQAGTEGLVAHLGGWCAGMVYGAVRLSHWGLRRQQVSIEKELMALNRGHSKPGRVKREGGPNLRVVYGGLSEEPGFDHKKDKDDKPTVH